MHLAMAFPSPRVSSRDGSMEDSSLLKTALDVNFSQEPPEHEG